MNFLHRFIPTSSLIKRNEDGEMSEVVNKYSGNRAIIYISWKPSNHVSLTNSIACEANLLTRNFSFEGWQASDGFDWASALKKVRGVGHTIASSLFCGIYSIHFSGMSWNLYSGTSILMEMVLSTSQSLKKVQRIPQHVERALTFPRIAQENKSIHRNFNDIYVRSRLGSLGGCHWARIYGKRCGSAGFDDGYRRRWRHYLQWVLQ